MYKLLITLYLFILLTVSFAIPAAIANGSVATVNATSDQASASFASIILTTQAQIEAASLPLLSEDTIPSESEIVQCLEDISNALSAATTSLKRLSTQSDAVVHAAYFNGQILLNKQLSDAWLARSFASLIYTLRVPMQSGASGVSTGIVTAFQNAAGASKSLFSSATTVIPGMPPLLRPLIRPLSPMMTALSIDI